MSALGPGGGAQGGNAVKLGPPNCATNYRKLKIVNRVMYLLQSVLCPRDVIKFCTQRMHTRKAWHLQQLWDRMVIPLLAASTCSSSSGNLRMDEKFSSHFSARKWRSVVFWLMDFVSRSYKKEKKKISHQSFSCQIHNPVLKLCVRLQIYSIWRCWSNEWTECCISPRYLFSKRRLCPHMAAATAVKMMWRI